MTPAPLRDEGSKELAPQKETIMDQLDEQVEAMRAMIEAVGGRVHIPEDAPGEIKRAFLRMIQECPDCRSVLTKRGH